MTSTPEPASPPVEPIRLGGRQAIDRMREERNQAVKAWKSERVKRFKAERKSKLYDQIIADIAAAQNQENQP